MEHIQSLKNHFLIATPELADSPFEKAVIYLFAHDADGAMGVVINQLHTISWPEVCSQLGIKPAIGHTPDVFAGGPVSVNHGYLLYQSDTAFEHSMTITPGLHVSTSSDQLKAIAAGQTQEQMGLYLGYSGWSPGQLDQEILDNAWLTLPGTPDLIFQTPPDQIYQSALERLGIDIHFFSHDAGHA